MSSKLWLDAYKPSLSNGIYGGYIYCERVEFYPKPLSYYLKDKNNEYYIRNKFDSTLKHINFDIDEWYKYVEPFTFKTKFICIHPKYAKSIILFYRYRYCNAKLNTLNIDIVNNLRELQLILDKEIKKCINKWYDDDDDEDKGVFIRFSNRSPKDGHKVYLNIDNIDDENKEEKIFENNDPNIEFIEFCRNSAKDLFVDNANDAMALILSSERVFSDMLAVINAHKYPYKYLFYHQFTAKTMYNDDDDDDDDDDENKEDIDDKLEWNEEEWDICNVSIAIRRWDNRIRDDLEFRCFIYDKKLRAISQYNHYCYFKELGDNKLFIDCIKNKINKYFKENIVLNVPYFNYIIDIGIILMDENNKENENNLQCIVIELNPFQKSTGAALFNWGNDENQLKFAKNIEMRVHHKNILTQNFVNHYTNDFEKYSVEKPWFQQLNNMEKEIINFQKNNSVNTKKTNCVLL